LTLWKTGSPAFAGDDGLVDIETIKNAPGEAERVSL